MKPGARRPTGRRDRRPAVGGADAVSGSSGRPTGVARPAGPRTVGELGEFPLIDRLKRILGSVSPPPPLGAGDDAALLPGGTATLVTTDVLEENIHFRRGWSLPAEVGFRALEVNLSDIAAMGGIPAWAVVSLVLPARLPVEAAEDLYRGLARSARRAGVRVVGGNVAASASGRVSIAITVLGRLAGRRAILRSGGRPGDLLIVSGHPGLAALGRRLLEEGGAPPPTTLDWRRSLEAGNPLARKAIHRFVTPEARLGVGVWAARAGATAMIDLSDGLAGDLTHLARASGVGARISLEALPLARGMSLFCAARGWSATDLALSGGDDYEILFAIPEARWKKAGGRAAETPARSEVRQPARSAARRPLRPPKHAPLAVIGRLESASRGLVLVDGERERVIEAGGYRHF